ncbi:MAG: J domain-containing protein [Spirochaetaceae bacterium]|nr:J domain-containing protein [Spirochaetaceae bacterium]
MSDDKDEDYYSGIGEFLKKNLIAEEDPFEFQTKRRPRYRQLGNVFERRPSPSIKYEEKSEEGFEQVLVPVPDNLIEDFAVLQLRPGSSLQLCKDSWRRLLKKFHPDTVTTKKSITLEEASQVVRRVNRAYKRISYWYETGLILETDTM